jgi:hypothetical protein
MCTKMLWLVVCLVESTLVKCRDLNEMLFHSAHVLADVFGEPWHKGVAHKAVEQ